jgi:hypothetical protein
MIALTGINSMVASLRAFGRRMQFREQRLLGVFGDQATGICFLRRLL